MRRKRAKFIAGLLCCVLAATTPLQSIATPGIAKTESGISYATYDDVDGYEDMEGYRVVKADASAVQDGTLTIPDSVDGKEVIGLDERFMAESGATKVVIGQNVKDLNLDAFFEAKNLKTVEAHSNIFATDDDDDPAVYVKKYSIMFDYPSAASTGADYRVNDATAMIYSMDNASFNRLDLNKVDTLAKHTLTGTTVNELVLANNTQTTVDGEPAESSSRQKKLELPGLHAGKFTLTQASENAYLQTDGGKSLYTDDGTLLKLASGVMSMSKEDWSKYTQISVDAFDNMAQYWSLSENIPESLKKNKVFHFYNQNNGVFIVNDQIAYCYDSEKQIPDNVTGSGDFDRQIDGEHYDQVNAVLFVGVPYNGTGLFEKIFGVSYDQAVKDTKMAGTGNAALNAVSSMVWEIVDGKPSDVIQGIGGTDYFTKEKVEQYTEALRAAANDAQSYTFTPNFQIDGGTLVFREQDDGKFLSDPFKVVATNGKGVVDDNYKIQMTMSGEGFSLKDKDGMTFETGEEIRIQADTQPSGQPLSFTYEQGTLTYYTPGNSSEEQFLLVSGTKSESASIVYSVVIKPPKDDLVISKRAVSGTDELPGATLKLTKKGGEEVAQWTSENTPHTLPMPEDGTYVLTEVTAPQGYEVAEEITFAIQDGQVVNGPIIMYDAPTPPPSQPEKLTISKRAVGGSAELPGAVLKLEKQGGGLVEQWTSGNEPHVIDMPEDGTYTLTEITAPDGYEVAEVITFTIENREVKGGSVVMYDKPITATPSEPTKLTISKRAVGGSEELPGARLKLEKEDETKVDEWTSGSTAHVIDMPEDGTYTLTEITAPDGYEVAEVITFTIEDGQVVGGPVIMYDKPTPKTQPEDLTISKRAVGGSAELPGAKLTITKQSDGSTVDSWTSGNTPHTIPMPEDGTYVLTEVTAPQGYEVAESITFIVKDGAVEGGMVIMYDKPEDKATPSEPDKPTTPSFEISKRDATTSEELPGAKLQIKDENGNVVEEWTSGNTPHKVEGLKDGTYTLTEVTAPNGYQVAETITFTVKDGTVEGGRVVMYDKPYPSKPNGPGGNTPSGSTPSHSGGGPGEQPTPTPTPTPQPTPQPTNPVPQQSDDLPKTQDVPSSLLLFWAAALTMAGILGDKKYRRVPETVD